MTENYKTERNIEHCRIIACHLENFKALKWCENQWFENKLTPLPRTSMLISLPMTEIGKHMIKRDYEYL